MSTRPNGYAATLLLAAITTVGGCTAAKPRGAQHRTAPAPSSGPAIVAGSHIDRGTWIVRAPLMPPARCSAASGKAVDIWCQPLLRGALARLGNAGASAHPAARPAPTPDDPADSPDSGNHSDAISSVAMSSDGELVATSAGDGVRLWQARTGRPILRLLLPAGCERQNVVVAFEADGHTLVAAGGCALRRYQLQSRRPLRSIPFAPLAPAPGSRNDERSEPACDIPLAIAVSKSTDMVAVTTSRGLLRRFRRSSDSELLPITVTDPGPYGFVTGLTRPVISADGAWIAVGLARELFVLNATDGQPHVRVMSGWERLVDLDFAPVGSTLAVLTSERLAVVDVREGKLLHAHPLERGISVGGALRYGPRGQRLFVLAGEVLSAHDGTTAAPMGILASGIDDGVDGLFAVAPGGLWIHPDGNARMLVRLLPAPR